MTSREKGGEREGKEGRMEREGGWRENEACSVCCVDRYLAEYYHQNGSKKGRGRERDRQTEREGEI